MRPGLAFEAGRPRGWSPDTPVDVIVSNATLQWVPDHLDLLPGLVDALAPDGWLAIQVPGNFDEPSHRLLTSWRPTRGSPTRRAGVERAAAPDAATYLADLAQLGCAVDAWETTYLHVLDGPDPVFRWISGTGARPVLQALSATSSARCSSRSTRHCCATAYPDSRTAPCCPSGGCSSSPTSRPRAARPDGLMLIRDARADDLEALLRLLDEDAIREVPEDLADLAPYAAALDEIVARSTAPCWSASSTARSWRPPRSPGSAG